MIFNFALTFTIFKRFIQSIGGFWDALEYIFFVMMNQPDTEGLAECFSFRALAYVFAYADLAHIEKVKKKLKKNDLICREENLFAGHDVCQPAAQQQYCCVRKVPFLVRSSWLLFH